MFLKSYEGIDNTSAKGVTLQKERQCRKSNEGSASKTMQ
jgi:hypothetical protein